MKITILLILFCFVTVTPSNEKTFILSSKLNHHQLSMLGTNHLVTPIKANKIKDLKIGIIDVGITNHPNLNIINLSNSWSKEIGHGTIIAAIIGAHSTTLNKYEGLIPGVKIYAYNLETKLSAEEIIKGIETLVKNNVDVISLSVSTQKPDERLSYIIKENTTKGLIFITSAGNTAREQNLYPAAFDIPGLISVGSLDSKYNISDFSTYNKNIDLFFPGEDIFSIGPTASQISKYSGSSVSVPFITSIVALTRIIYPESSSSEIINYLNNHSETYMASWKNTARPVKILALNQMYKE
jgi:subtilisin